MEYCNYAIVRAHDEIITDADRPNRRQITAHFFNNLGHQINNNDLLSSHYNQILTRLNDSLIKINSLIGQLIGILFEWLFLIF